MAAKSARRWFAGGGTPAVPAALSAALAFAPLPGARADGLAGDSALVAAPAAARARQYLDVERRRLELRERVLSAPAAPAPGEAEAAPQPTGSARPSGGPDPAFKLGEAYCFPNPAASGAVPTFHVEAGLADSVRVELYDAAGERVAELSASGPPGVVEDGQGPRYAYELRWEGPIASGVYAFVARAEKDGVTLTASGRCAVVR